LSYRIEGLAGGVEGGVASGEEGSHIVGNPRAGGLQIDDFVFTQESADAGLSRRVFKGH
jgi:hypothetical protein